MEKREEIYIIGGPNGSGKTTFVNRYLPNYLDIRNFVNADAIAFGLSPLDYSAGNIKAGKIMLQLIYEFKDKGISFGFETTLAGKRWLEMIHHLKKSGYVINIFFLDISTIKLAIERIRNRVLLGGHNIPKETIERRYGRARSNFWHRYKGVADNWYLFDNSNEIPKLIAYDEQGKTNILNRDYYRFFVSSVSKSERGKL